MSLGFTPFRLHAAAIIAAMFLSACGGGGGGSSDNASAGNPATGSTSTGGTNTSNATPVTADTRAQANKQYQVTATNPVTITLPTTLAVGDTITVTGVSNAAWTIAQNAGQIISTTALPGNSATGQSWTPHMAVTPWWWVASNVAGDVRVASVRGTGGVHVSTDGGQTWNETLPVNQVWISVDMTPSGDRIVAVGYQGTMYMSNDRGSTWTEVTSAGPGARNWESVAISDDGQRIVGSVQNGAIYVSTDGGASWTATTPPRLWRTVSMSANGLTVLALEQDGSLWRSTDGGMNFTSLNFVGNWYRTDMSADGQVMVVAEMDAGAMYVSRNGGANWTRATDAGGTPLAGRWSGVSVSRDGQRILASASGVSSAPGGGVYFSDNGGASFSTFNMPGSDNNWRSVAMSGDGNMLTAATGDNFDHFGSTAGLVYTSNSNRTATGTLGAVVGGQGQTLQLRYVGDGRFEATSTGGGSYTIR